MHDVQNVDRLFLVGFMGAGKSTVAKALSARIGWQAVETDELIVQSERRSIPEIFAKEGEPYFRRLESKIVRELFLCPEIVISTGGGAFIQDTNRAPMLANGIVVWLDVPFEAIIERVNGDENRPLAKDPKKMKALYDERRPVYARAHISIKADRPIHEIVAEVLRVTYLG